MKNIKLFIIVAISFSFVNCYHYRTIPETNFDTVHEGSSVNYSFGWDKSKDFKNDNGLLHYYVVDTIELRHPVLVAFDLNTTFIMEESVFNAIEPSYENYTDNDYVYIFARGFVGGSIRDIYSFDDNILGKYSSRVNFTKERSVLEIVDSDMSRNYELNRKTINMNNHRVHVSKWINAPSKYAVILIRGNSYRVVSYCFIDHEYKGSESSLRPLPISNHYSYYKMLYPIFE